MKKTLAVLLLAGLVACSTREEQLEHVVREERVLLRCADPFDPEWQEARAQCLLDAELVAPSVSSQ